MGSLRSLLFVLLLLLGSEVSAQTKYPVKKVITLMMENRSFDHFLGRLNSVMPGINGLTGNECNYENATDTSSKAVPVNQNAMDGGPDDPCHSWDCINEQQFGYAKPVSESAPVLMSGFVQNAKEQQGSESFVMSGFNTTTLPILTTLAQEFAVFDAWFCSCPCPTNPNREYAMSGTSGGYISNTIPTALFPQQTHFNFLAQHNKTWKIYYHDSPWGASWFKDLSTPEALANIQTIDHFWSDVASGNVADYIFLEPRLSTTSPTEISNWQHPDNSVSEGEKLIKQVYESIRSSSFWNESMLIITYDEHGGFYDHAPSPQDGIPNPDGIKASNGFNFDRLGVRIPTVVVSPWINKGVVVHQPTGAAAPTPTSQYESTSIIATTNKILGVTGSLSKRQDWAGTFDYLLLERSTIRTDCPVTLPDVNPLTKKQIEEEMFKPLNDHHIDQIDLFCTLTDNLPLCGREAAASLKQRDYQPVAQKLWNDYVRMRTHEKL